MPDDEEAEMGLETPEDEDILEEEVVVVEPTVVILEDDLDMDLQALLGDEGYKTLLEVAESGFKTLDEFVKVTVLEDTPLGSIEVFNGKNRGPHNMVVVDTDGKSIDLSKVGLEDSGKGYEGYSVDSLFDTTVFAPGWSPSNLGAALVKVFEAKLTLGDLEANKRDHDAMLKQIRNSMTHLGDVFGFDDYEHLEMFFAAWLMQDSTCRLSGIPGTGKTTVIEAAAVLLCNSYGYNARPVYVAPTGRTFLTEDGEPDYEKLFGKDRVYVAQEYEAGQDYHLNYSNPAYADVHEGWDSWRFTDWMPPNGEIRSGSYLYDFEFLHLTGTKDDEPFTKTPLKSEDFYRLLTNCYKAEVPVAGFKDPAAGSSDHVEGEELLAKLEEEQIHTVIAPIQLLKANGDPADFGKPLTYTVYDSKDKPHEFEMELRFPDVGVSATNELNYEWILSQGDPAEFMQNEWGLFTDAGRSEGYGFRQYLQQNFVDERSKKARQSKNPDWKTILEEMMREQGVAKIDYEKRADEVLYGIEIQQREKYNKLRDTRISTYEFEPVPRPIVTQPIKFFNEANRSQAGVEDAILGLIAERKVEYRGKTFNSPHFVAWMDTNPHQKGNDLAFIDRIDMELLFKSISLGSRYTVLSDKYAGRGGLSPQEQLVSKLAEGGDIGFSAMRFRELEKVWQFIISMIKYSPPGQATGTSTYDALREISYISVLFTQRFQPRFTTLKSGTDLTFTTKSAGNFYESPLIDFSSTTNTSDEGESKQIMPSDMKATYKAQTPFSIGRVLGFRFTNSLVKLSSALAFLRGKSYVHRKEILDGLPYVTAHRLGRAKTSKGEQSGLDSSLGFSNEQEWIREAIVNAYLLQDIEVGFSKGSMPIMDTWELYYRRCMDALKSAPALFWYEQQVLKPLHERLSKGKEDVGMEMTPVHWHIATMVVDNERTANKDSATKPVRIYTHGDSEENNYKSNYNYYLTRVFSSPNPHKSPSDQTLADFFELRGDICDEPNLFSDDRDTLLDLLASTMATICGGPSISEVGNCSSKAIVSHKTHASKDQETFDHDTTKFSWRTYHDGIGAWGKMLQSPGTGGLVSVPDQFIISQVKGDGSAASFADQALMITGRMEVKVPTKKESLIGAGTLQRNMMVAQVQKLGNKFGPDVSEGVIIKDTGVGDTSPITFDKFITLAKKIVTEYSARKDFDDGQFEVGGISFDMMGHGLLACFPLKHTAGVPSGGGDFSGEDTLRLWVRLFQSDKSKKVLYTSGKKSVPFVTLNMTMGITSNLATKNEMLNVVPMNDRDKLAYTNSAYKTDYEGKLKGIGKDYEGPDQIQDSGNLSAVDMLNYQVAFTEAIKIETA